MDNPIFDGFPHTPITLAEAIVKAYQRLYTATLEVGMITSSLADAQATLRASRDEILRTNDPKALGANEASREAVLREMTASGVQLVATIENELRGKQDNQRAAQTQVDGLRAQLRIMEMVVAAETVTKGGRSDATGF